MGGSDDAERVREALGLVEEEEFSRSRISEQASRRDFFAVARGPMGVISEYFSGFATGCAALTIVRREADGVHGDGSALRQRKGDVAAGDLLECSRGQRLEPTFRKSGQQQL